jgi:CoA-transferase family III
VPRGLRDDSIGDRLSSPGITAAPSVELAPPAAYKRLPATLVQTAIVLLHCGIAAMSPDILVKNFRLEMMQRWNIGYEALSAVNPRLFMVHASGFGLTGPNRHKYALDRIDMAFGGLMDVIGYPETPPVRPAFSIADYTTGLFNALGVLAAVDHRDITGTRRNSSSTPPSLNRCCHVGRHRARRAGARHPQPGYLHRLVGTIRGWSAGAAAGRYDLGCEKSATPERHDGERILSLKYALVDVQVRSRSS